VGDGDRAGLLRVVHEVALGEVVGLLADDLDGVLVGADRAVGTETEEEAAEDVVAGDVEVVVHGSEVWLTSSTIPTVKWFFGSAAARLSNTALTMGR
jgi:hypothetical protein